MIRIEVIGLDPPCTKCKELLANVESAVEGLGIEADVSKKWTLSEEIRNKYGLLLSPALAIEGVVVFQGKVFKAERLKQLLRWMVKNLKESKTTTHARRLYARGYRLQQAGKLDEAVSELSRAIDCDARCAEAYFSRGACHYMLGHYRLARNDLDAAAVLGCEEAQLWSKFDNRSYVPAVEDQ